MVSNPESTVTVDALFAAAQAKVGDKDLRGALRVLLELLLLEPLHDEGLRAAARLASHLGSKEDADRFTAVAEEPTDPQALYDLGFTFVEQGLPGLAVRYLERCVEHEPDHPLVRYELGYALFQAGAFETALPHLARTAADGSLAGPEPFAASLLMVECHLHLGDLDAARDAFEAIDATGDAQADAQLDAIAATIARAARRFGTGRLDARDWYFIEQGGVTLRVDPELPGGTLGVDWIADLLRRLEAVVDALDVAPEVVSFVSPESKPIAAALAYRLGAQLIDAESFDPHADEPTLLVAKEPAEFVPMLTSLRVHDDDLHLFAVTLDPRVDHPIAPDIVGLFSSGVRLPWESRLEIEGRSAEDVSVRQVDEDLDMRRDADKTIVAAMQEMDGDDEEIDEAVALFKALEDALLVGNADRHPSRRVYAARQIPRTFLAGV